MPYTYRDGRGQARVQVPRDLGKSKVLFDFLNEIGLDLHYSARLAAAEDRALGTAGKRFTEPEIDAAAAKFAMNFSERLQLKMAMFNEGLIRREDEE
jgi:hypothetical protein